MLKNGISVFISTYCFTNILMNEKYWLCFSNIKKLLDPHSPKKMNLISMKLRKRGIFLPIHIRKGQKKCFVCKLLKLIYYFIKSIFSTILFLAKYPTKKGSGTFANIPAPKTPILTTTFRRKSYCKALGKWGREGEGFNLSMN